VLPPWNQGDVSSAYDGETWLCLDELPRWCVEVTQPTTKAWFGRNMSASDGRTRVGRAANGNEWPLGASGSSTDGKLFTLWCVRGVGERVIAECSGARSRVSCVPWQRLEAETRNTQLHSLWAKSPRDQSLLSSDSGRIVESVLRCDVLSAVHCSLLLASSWVRITERLCDDHGHEGFVGCVCITIAGRPNEMRRMLRLRVLQQPSRGPAPNIAIKSTVMAQNDLFRPR
jgi:hypothetical protein